MIVVVVGVALFGLLVWAGRRRTPLRQHLRLASALLAAVAAVGAVVSGLRGSWPGALILIGLAAYLGQAARGYGRPTRIAADEIRMTPRQARSILGVEEGVSRAAIEEAYRRLIRRAHPDLGGSSGLAAQINAARDCLLRR